MPKRLTLVPHLSCADLEQRYRRATDPVERTHYQILWLMATGKTTQQIAEVTGYSLRWIRVLINRYNEQGPDGTGDQRHQNPGADPLLDDVQQAQLLQVLSAPVTESGLWNGRKVAEWMSRVLDRPVAAQRGWEYLKQMEFQLRVPRPEHQQQRPYDLSSCTGQRILSPAGIEASKEIGQAFKHLNIPVAEVLSSPLCRTRDTAKFAFGQVTLTKQLMGEDREIKRSRIEVGNDLKQLVNQKTIAGKNLILVGHFGSSLALDRVLSEGEALVLKPASQGQVEIVGQITSAQWGDVVRDIARMQPAQKSS